MKYSIVSALSFAIFAAAKDVMVDVGEDGLTFGPESISCSSGDRVIFTIYAGGHSVVSSDATHPCVADNKISSGDIDPKASNNGNKFTIDCPSATTYLFCAAPEHCKLGMVAVINGNSNQLTTYKNMAKNGPNAGSPPSVAGGVAGPVSPASGGSSSGGSNGGGGESSTSGSAAPAATTAAGTAGAAPAATTGAAPAATTAPAATGGASSSFASFGAAVFAAVIALF